MIYLNEIESVILFIVLVVFLVMELLKTYRPKTANQILRIYKKGRKTILLIAMLPFCIAVLTYRYIRKYFKSL